MVVSFRTVLFGYGSVNQELLNMIEDSAKREMLLEEHQVQVHVMGIVRSQAAMIFKHTLDIQAINLMSKTHLSRAVTKKEESSDMVLFPSPTLETMDSFISFLQDQEINLVVEAIPVNYESSEPALSITKACLCRGIHVVSANKGPVVHAYSELQALARKNCCSYKHESAVMDGVPIFNLVQRCLMGARLLGFRGVLNSTTSVVLSGMEEGNTFEEALQRARDMGIVETDPAGDIDGWDAAVKTLALVRVLMKIDDVPKLEDIPRDSIASLTREDIESASEQGKRYKVICSASRLEKSNALENISVKLEMLDRADVFYNLEGSSAAVQFVTDVCGPITITSTNPTVSDTAFGCLTDIVSIASDI